MHVWGVQLSGKVNEDVFERRTVQWKRHGDRDGDGDGDGDGPGGGGRKAGRQQTRASDLQWHLLTAKLCIIFQIMHHRFVVNI